MHAKVLQGFHSLRDAGENRHADVFDKHILCGRCATLHAIQHNNIGTRLYGESRVIIRSRTADFHINRYFPIGNFTQFEDLDFKIIRPRPIRMATGRTLVDALWQVAHVGYTV